MQLKRQKDQVNHCGKRLRVGFNKKRSGTASKSGPNGQNLHFSNANPEEYIHF